MEEVKDELYAGGKPRATAYQTAAEYQMIRGPFNVNSTSVQAWKAVLASMNKSDVHTLWAKSGTLEILKAGGHSGDRDVADQRWPLRCRGGSGQARQRPPHQGMERLSRAFRISRSRTLPSGSSSRSANAGPSSRMSEFVNRRVGAESELTRSGALEAGAGQGQYQQPGLCIPDSVGNGQLQ